jgi:hypothetical protein
MDDRMRARGARTGIGGKLGATVSALTRAYVQIANPDQTSGITAAHGITLTARMP